MIFTTITCDIKGCNSKLEIRDDQETIGAEELLEVTDANHKKHWFCCIEHLRQWANGYCCPYKKTAPQGESN